MEESVIQINGGIIINVDVSVKTSSVKKRLYLESCYMLLWKWKYSASISDDLVTACDEIIDADAEAKAHNETKLNNKEIKRIPTNFNEKTITSKTQNFYILPAFLLITIALLMTDSTYCYLKKYWAKQTHLLSFPVTNNKLREVSY